MRQNVTDFREHMNSARAMKEISSRISIKIRICIVCSIIRVLGFDNTIRLGGAKYFNMLHHMILNKWGT